MTDASAPAETASAPAWYWLVSVACLMFESAGAYLFANSLTLDPLTLPLDQRAIFDATPQWMAVAWGIAIATGFLGAIGLLLRRNFAEPLLLISLIAVAVQFSGLFLIRQLRELTPENHLIVPVVILAAAYGFWQTAKLARGKRLLR
jgi:hypothetical protein